MVLGHQQHAVAAAHTGVGQQVANAFDLALELAITQAEVLIGQGRRIGREGGPVAGQLVDTRRVGLRVEFGRRLWRGAVAVLRFH